MKSPTITRATKKILRDNAKKVNAIYRELKAEMEARMPVFEGRKNECSDEFFAEICCLTQNELKLVLPTLLRQRGYEDIIIDDGFIYAKGDIPVLLTAHMDTVHEKPIEDYYEKEDEDGNHVLYSPQGIGGDDRCGIYMILRIIEKYKCSVVFCEDEEVGCVGSKKFCDSKYIKDVTECKYIIGLDRANANDAVFYSCDNPEFTKFITENIGYKEAWGSYSDISYIAPEAGVAAVNLSCGYHKPHQKEEYVVIEEMYQTINAVKDLLEVDCEKFEYIEEEYIYSGGYGDYYGYYGYEKPSKKTMGICAYFYNEELQEDSVYAEGESLMECWGRLFLENPKLCMNDIVDFETY